MSDSEIMKEGEDANTVLNNLKGVISKAYENDDDPVLEHDQVFNIKHEIIFSKKEITRHFIVSLRLNKARHELE